MSAKGKVALVTGGSGGLGSVHCFSLAAAGFKVAVAAHIHLDKAKIIVDKKNSLLAELDGYRYEMNSSVIEVISELKNRLVAFRHMLKSPMDRLQEKVQLLDELMVRLTNNMQHIMELSRRQASGLFERLQALSPLAVLSRGYSLSLLLPQGLVIKDAGILKPKDRVKTTLADGSFISIVEEVIKDVTAP